MADAKSREASLITFLAASANITLFGIGGAFWGLLIGLVAYAVLNGQLPRRQPVANPTVEVASSKGVAN
ncbi:Inner membrane protein YdcO [compost metagenome]